MASHLPSSPFIPESKMLTINFIVILQQKLLDIYIIIYIYNIIYIIIYIYINYVLKICVVGGLLFGVYM